MMIPQKTLAAIVVASAFPLTFLAASDPSQAERNFALKVYPLLQSKCFACHDTATGRTEGMLDLSSRKAMLSGGESGDAALVPGSPEESLLISAVKRESLEMPPKENDRLTDEQIELLEDWIRDGSVWVDESGRKQIQESDWSQQQTADGVLVATSGGLSEEWTNRRYKPEELWAIQPVQRPALPMPGHPVDAFINTRLAEANLTPAPLASPEELIRRVTFDLTGLPPSYDDVLNFCQEGEVDPEAAWNSLIDRLLASPQYGVHWAQHWLDVVRYADTSGISNDWERSNAWRFRDYVVRSFNEDKPFDQFIREQIAGDEIDPQNPEMLIATGYLRMGPWEHTNMSPANVTRQEYLDDLVNNIGEAFLSTSLRCCKCHDHKFDPIPTRDYYRFYATLSSTQPTEREAPFLDVEQRSDFLEDRRHVESLLKFAEQERDRLYEKREIAARQWYAERNRANEYLPGKERLKLKTEDKPPRYVGLSYEEQGILKVREQDVRIWKRRRERYEPMVQSVYNGGFVMRQSEKLRVPTGELAQKAVLETPCILTGGDVNARGPEVTPGVLSALGLPTSFGSKSDPYPVPQDLDGRRRVLADWIASPDNPLSTRSIVNRVWTYHVGRGIAANPNNFGATGARPSHPELLDYLVGTFLDSGWSIKKLHRLILTSEAYRRDCQHPESETLSTLDPDNHLFAVFLPRRLNAEELRDATLSVTGELNLKLGGLPSRPEINLEVALLPRRIQFAIAPAYQPSPTPESRNRRSLYAYRIRGMADPLMEVFNKPVADDSCERRETSVNTPQVLSQLNGDWMTKRSLAMARRISQLTILEQQLQHISQDILSRDLTDKEHAIISAYYHETLDVHQKNHPEREHPPTRVTRGLVEELSGTPFEYEEWLNVYESYQPDLQAADLTAPERALADVCLLLLNSNEFLYVY